MYIGVTGLIGAGKSTLARDLAQHMGYTLLEEPADANPYLRDYYGNMRRWAFEFDAWLTAHGVDRYREAGELRNQGAVTDQIYDVDWAFTETRWNYGYLDNRSWYTLQHLRSLVGPMVPRPDLILYLKVEPQVALDRIRSRNRASEEAIDLGYLRALSRNLDGVVASLCQPVLELDWSHYLPVEQVVELINEHVPPTLPAG